jgi:hypothetical protein
MIDNERRIEMRLEQVYRQSLQMAHFVANRWHSPITPGQDGMRYALFLFDSSVLRDCLAHQARRASDSTVGLCPLASHFAFPCVLEEEERSQKEHGINNPYIGYKVSGTSLCNRGLRCVSMLSSLPRILAGCSMCLSKARCDRPWIRFQ